MTRRPIALQFLLRECADGRLQFLGMWQAAAFPRWWVTSTACTSPGASSQRRALCHPAVPALAHIARADGFRISVRIRVRTKGPGSKVT